PYVTKACTNCQDKHKRCSGRATCNHCTLFNLNCIFVDSGKKRGPKKNHRPLEQNYIFNGAGFNFDETSMLFSNTSNLVQIHALFPFGNQLNASQQPPDNNYITFDPGSDNELQGIFVYQDIVYFY
ncbi:26907_t:CDS:1, partial [Racocetra persica]